MEIHHIELYLPKGWSALSGFVSISNVVILNLFLSLCLFALIRLVAVCNNPSVSIVASILALIYIDGL